MRTTLLLIICWLLAYPLAAQPGLRQLAPTIGAVPDVSAQAQQQFKRRDLLLEKPTRSPTEEAELKRLLEQNSEAQESVWDVIGGGCSWYCGGGSYKETASSVLGPAYVAAKAHDLSLQYAWVEGVPGDGIGESLTYYFKNDSPRINQVKVYNGYLKSPTLWQANSRVKKLKMWVNDEPYAVLNLRDSPALQSYPVPLLGHRADKKDLVLRFEILEVYHGTKYQDTVLTEVFFSGVDVH